MPHSFEMSSYTQRMLRTRLVVGTLLVVALFALAALDTTFPTISVGTMRLGPGAILMLVCVAAFAPVLAGELSRMLMPKHSRATFLLNVGAVLFGIASVAIFPAELPEHLTIPVVVTLAFALLVAAALCQVRSATVDGFVPTVCGLLLGYAAIGVPLGFWLLLRHDTETWTMAAAILCVKSADIGAYFTGITLGRHKMIPWLSPGKSWEGFAGGVVLSALVGAGFGALSGSDAGVNNFVNTITVGEGALIAVILGVFGTCGDLFESMIKRAGGVKDSGSLLPGMGGLYDVFDSLLFAGPVAWWLLVGVC